MSIAALGAPNIEISAPDTMDLHSDNGLDFDDGDIDLDLRSTGGDMDDDVSLRDAGMDAGQDVQTVQGDNDDFMADHEDLIEEDIVDDNIEVVEQLEPTVPEEDLIDYSDEEDVVVEHTPVILDAPQTDNHDIPVAADIEEPSQTVAQEPLSEEHDREAIVQPQTASANIQEFADLASVEEHEDHSGEQFGDEASPHEQEEPENAAIQAADTSYEESHISERDTADPQVDRSTTSGVDNDTNEPSGQDPQDSFHPVNVHFDGHDYWLFKHHDYEESGDYLLENEAIFKQPIHVVVDACRNALRTLGANVSNDLELGFRLDSLYNVELFEEHPTCHFFNLSFILRVYLQLHAQDGNADPDYFCITLLSRPRVSTLVAELHKAATEGIGFSGLNAAIAAGLSSLNTQYPDDSPQDTHDVWEEGDDPEASEGQSDVEADEQYDNRETEHIDAPDEEQDDVNNSSGPYTKSTEEAQEQSNLEDQVTATLGEQDHQETSNQAENEEEAENDEHANVEFESGETRIEEASQNANGSFLEKTTAVGQVNTGLVGQAANAANAAPQERDENPVNPSVNDQHSLQDDQEDLLDYSDGEDETVGNDPVQQTHASSESATVQGDDLTQTQNNVEETVQYEQQNEDIDDAGEATYEGYAEPDAEKFTEYDGHGYPYHEFDGQDYGQEHNDGYEQGYNEGQELEAYPAYDASQADETTNYPGEDEQYPNDVFDDTQVPPNFNLGEFDAVDDASVQVDDASNLDSIAAAAQRVKDEHAAEDEIDYSDEEDGAVSQTLVATSAAADTVATSSSGLQNLSPQGQKRTIDEVGNDVANATNSTGKHVHKRCVLQWC